MPVTGSTSLRIGPFNVVALVIEETIVPSTWCSLPWFISVMVPVLCIEEVARNGFAVRAMHVWCMDVHNSS